MKGGNRGKEGKQGYRVLVTSPSQCEINKSESQNGKRKTMNENTQITESEVPSPVPATQPVPLVTPSPTLYGELAAGLSADLDQFTASVPGFDDETVSPEFVRRKQRIGAPFVNKAVGALFGNNELLAIKPLDAAETMDDKQYVDAMSPLVQKLGTVYKRLRFTVQVREARLTRKAQQIYGVAKELARDRETSVIRIQVDEMAKALKAGRTKPAPKPEEAPAAPAPGKEGETTTTRR